MIKFKLPLLTGAMMCLVSQFALADRIETLNNNSVEFVNHIFQLSSEARSTFQSKIDEITHIGLHKEKGTTSFYFFSKNRLEALIQDQELSGPRFGFHPGFRIKTSISFAPSLPTVSSEYTPLSAGTLRLISTLLHFGRTDWEEISTGFQRYIGHFNEGDVSICLKDDNTEEFHFISDQPTSSHISQIDIIPTENSDYLFRRTLTKTSRLAAPMGSSRSTSSSRPSVTPPNTPR
jgi:hypothetical protein